jgi:D-alanine-D-alanine ligase
MKDMQTLEKPIVRVGVLRGGPSAEYDISLKTGGNVLKHLPERYKPLDVFVDKEGDWHVQGVKKSPRVVLRMLDVAFIALHGAYGEDGTLQHLLESFGIPYTGSRSLESRLAMHKRITKEMLSGLSINFPKHSTIRKEPSPESIAYLFQKLSKPSIIKPSDSGSSIGVRKTHSFDEFYDAIHEALEISDEVLVEEYIQGREVTCGVIDNFRGQSSYALPPVEIITGEQHDFFNYEAKYSEETREICPTTLSKETKEFLEEATRTIHETLGLRHYSRSDFIVSPQGVYFLEVNTLPGLTSESLFPKSLKAVGCNFPQFLDHLITLALEGR